MIAKVLRWAGIVVAVSLSLFPCLWILSTSFKLPREYFSSPPAWIPSDPTAGHYVALMANLGGASYFKNSLIIGVASTLFALLVAVPAAYSMGVYRIGGEGLNFWILSQRMLPAASAVIPLFLIYSRLGLVDTFPGMILAYCIFNVPLAIGILVGFFADFPKELVEQAFVDGATEFVALYRIVLPLVAPGLVVVALFCFLASWNELLFALVFTGENTQTVMKLLASLLQSPTSAQFGPAAAAVTLGMIPAFALTYFIQRYIVQGLTAGSLKD